MKRSRPMPPSRASSGPIPAARSMQPPAGGGASPAGAADQQGPPGDAYALPAWLGAGVAAVGGFVVLVLEIVGARYLARDFGSSFYVWVSQIGVVMVALALGYYVGGALADRWRGPGRLIWLLVPTGGFVYVIPRLAPPVLEALVNRHPPDEPIPPVWQRLDPALGSAVVFLLPCFVLAMLSPYFIRLSSRQIAHVGRISGLIIAASTAGSIAGVFVAGYLLVDLMSLSAIFRGCGLAILFLAVVCWVVDRRYRRT